MVRALGYSQNAFNPGKPGRLCRGRERWIEPWDLEDPPSLQRLVVTGAAFTDDSAADAHRGLQHSGIDTAHLLHTLFPRRELLAFMEDGHPADIPADAEHVEMYSGHRAGGRSEQLMVRWVRKVQGVTQVREVLGEHDERVLGFVWLHPGVEVDDDVVQRIFLLTGMGSLDSPPMRFQPAALDGLLEISRAVVLLHRDKHGTAVGVYTREDPGLVDKVRAIGAGAGVLAVPFAIPPMLARWDRALAELRTTWFDEHPGQDFPVPPAPEPTRWSAGRRDRRRDKLAKAAKKASSKARDGGDDEVVDLDDAFEVEE